MRYKLKYQTRGKVETYIAMTTSVIAMMQDQLYAESELNTSIATELVDALYNLLIKLKEEGVI